MKVLVRVASVMVLIVFLVLSYGCSKANSPSTTNSALEPYKIGAVFAKTGANSSIGTPEAQTMEMVVAEINAAGGINGHSLQAIIYDTQSDTTQALTLVKKLIEQDNVAAIVGPSSTGESLAVLDTVTKSGVPLISCASSSQITTPIAERKWVFKSAGEDVLAVQKLTDYLTQLKITKVALICDSNGYGQTGRTVLMSALPKAGATIVADEKYDSNDTDMSIQLTKIKGTDAQAVVCWGTNPAPAIVAKNMKQLNFTIPFVSGSGIANQKFIELASDAANGAVFPASKLLVADQLDGSDPQKATLVKYKADFEAKYGANSAVPFGGHSFDATRMLEQALKKVGADRSKIRDYLETNITNFVGITGVFTYTSTDHAGLTKDAFILIKIVNGKWTWFK